MQSNRRNFIKSSTSVAVALTLGAIPPTYDMPSVKTYGDGLIGVSSWLAPVPTIWKLPQRCENGTGIFVEDKGVTYIALNNQWLELGCA